MSTDLAIPDARHVPIPTGWLEQVLVPAVAGAQWDDLDDAEGRIKAMASYLEAHDADSVELEKALRVIEARRGQLILDNQTVFTRENPKAPIASRWRSIARNWDWLWPERILPATSKGNVTQAKVLRYIDERTPAQSPDVADVALGDVTLWHGDFRERLIALEPGSVDLILTDPPYPNEYLPLWYDLAEISAKLLSPKGYLLAMSGKIHLDQVMELLGEHLEYKWVLNWPLGGAASRILSRNIRQTWKPILCYTVGSFYKRDPLPDTIPTGAAEKDTMHAWQQQVAPAEWLVEHFTAPGGLVVDPFLGSGSFGLAAKQMGRRFVGVELDGDRFEKAVERLL